MMPEYLLETKKLSITFGGLRALQNLNLRIKKNEIYGLIGPNGAGKSTVFNILSGVYQPTDGSFYLSGEELTGLSQERICAMGVARTFQNIRLFNNMTVIRNVMVALHNLPEFRCGIIPTILRFPKQFRTEREMIKRAEELLEIFDLYDSKNLLACNLSYGNQRKLEIARALATSPKLLLLDEPAAGMNPKESESLTETIRFVRDNFDMTIILIEHDMKLVSDICDRVSVLNFGTLLAEGRAKEALSNPEVVRAYLGDDA